MTSALPVKWTQGFLPLIIPSINIVLGLQKKFPREHFTAQFFSSWLRVITGNLPVNYIYHVHCDFLEQSHDLALLPKSLSSSPPTTWFAGRTASFDTAANVPWFGFSSARNILRSLGLREIGKDASSQSFFIGGNEILGNYTSSHESSSSSSRSHLFWETMGKNLLLMLYNLTISCDRVSASLKRDSL